MKVTRSETIPDILIIQPMIYRDARGSFVELYNRKRYSENGIDVEFVQENSSQSGKSILRGLHYQLHSPQGKLVCALEGEVFDVAVDIRRSSPTFGKHFSMTLSAEDGTQLYIPPGFAHGFCVLSDYARFYYKCTDFYNSGDEKGIVWNDPRIGVPWPVSDPIVSEKDRLYSMLDAIEPEYLFR